ncbi:hypothetical protein, partial [Methylobacterium sp. WL18]|uniref:hypothetical protein n=1 Tax=Methylobacterium sp. WL18 TaxID=2603897 RepID=UPI001AEEBC11
AALGSRRRRERGLPIMGDLYQRCRQKVQSRMPYSHSRRQGPRGIPRPSGLDYRARRGRRVGTMTHV